MHLKLISQPCDALPQGSLQYCQHPPITMRLTNDLIWVWLWTRQLTCSDGICCILKAQDDYWLGNWEKVLSCMNIYGGAGKNVPPPKNPVIHKLLPPGLIEKSFWPVLVNQLATFCAKVWLLWGKTQLDAAVKKLQTLSTWYLNSTGSLFGDAEKFRPPFPCSQGNQTFLSKKQEFITKQKKYKESKGEKIVVQGNQTKKSLSEHYLSESEFT